MTLDPRRTLLLPALLATLAIVAGCTSGGGATGAPSVAAPSESAAASEEPSESAAASEEPSASASASAAAGVSLALADSDLGQIIVDGEGKTLYMFDPDTAGTPTCYDECAAAWPALLADDAASVTAGTGLDASKITVVARTDGGSQVKYGNWPLYYFANDAAAGDTNGQGLNDVWWVIGADGEPIKS
jgi:predicted lipoprotein with Yx(FWY)xxD motif